MHKIDPAIRGLGREAKHNEDVPQLQGAGVLSVLDKQKIFFVSQTLNAWYIYLHLVNLHGECR